MKIFVYDTETTGLFKNDEVDITKQPHIVQIAGIYGELENGEFKEIKRIDWYIKPPISIPFEVSQIHNIYDIDVKNALSIDKYMDEFTQIINEADLVVGHNIEYDEKIVKLELRRLGKTHDYSPKQVICTMKKTVDYCQLPSGKDNGKFKYPKLSELHKKLFGEYFLGSHNAIHDVEATLKSFIKLLNEKIIKLDDGIKINNLRLF